MVASENAEESEVIEDNGSESFSENESSGNLFLLIVHCDYTSFVIINIIRKI